MNSTEKLKMSGRLHRRPLSTLPVFVDKLSRLSKIVAGPQKIFFGYQIQKSGIFESGSGTDIVCHTRIHHLRKGHKSSNVP